MAPQVIAKASSHQVIGLLLLTQAVQGQALHGQSLCGDTNVGKSLVYEEKVSLLLLLLLTHLHALQTWGWRGFVCRTSVRFCTACARNIAVEQTRGEVVVSARFTWEVDNDGRRT